MRCLVMALLGCLSVSPVMATVVRACFNEVLGNDRAGHFSLALMHAAARQSRGIQLQLVPRPWSRCQAEVARGVFDAVVGASYTAERAADLQFPRDVTGSVDHERRMFRLGFLLLRRNGSRVTWDGERITGLSAPVGVERGHAMAGTLRRRGLRVDDQNVSLEAMLAKLARGRLAAVVVNDPQWLSLQAWHPDRLAGIERVGPPLMHKDYHLAFSKVFAQRHPELAEQLWEGVAIERDTASFEQLFAEQQGWHEGQPMPEP